MKIKILLLFFITCMASAFTYQKSKKIIFFGDSITELGIKPDGYITMLSQTIEQKKLTTKYDLVGAGISGNKVYDLYFRLEDDVLSKNPDAVVIWVGVNDVWHKRLLGTGTDVDKFEKFYTSIIKKLKEKNIQVYVCTPAMIGEKWDCTNPLDGELNIYANLIKKIAKNLDCPLIDLRQSFVDYLKTNNADNKDKGILTTDGVHLNERGNSFVAEQMFHVLQKGFLK